MTTRTVSLAGVGHGHPVTLTYGLHTWSFISKSFNDLARCCEKCNMPWLVSKCAVHIAYMLSSHDECAVSIIFAALATSGHN
jgi:hypothetical protein